MADTSWRAPGRVNLIGEHTDYNEGFVLPFALAQGCTATVATREDGIVHVSSLQRSGAVAARVDELEPGTGDRAEDRAWARYALGVPWALRQEGHRVPGLRVEVDGDVPPGAGLASSAALVCSVTTAVDDLLSLGLSADDLLRVARRAENDFVGARTGGMDQLASLRCTPGHALLADMRTLETEQVPFDLGTFVILVVDTKAPHRHVDGEYRTRRDACERAAALLGVRALRDVTDPGRLAGLEEPLRRYARHVVTENRRVLDMVAALRASGAGDRVDPADADDSDGLARVGALMTASHASLRDDLAITVPEVDTAQQALLDAGALGARMTGGGFGGCVIGLVAAERVEHAAATVTDAFERRGFAVPAHVTARASGGAHRIS